MPLQVQVVETQQKLYEMILDRHGRPVAGFIRAGSTEDPCRRKSQYEEEGYGGTMFCVRTDNMRRAEDQLLQSRDFRYNVHKRSNADETPGYIYVIQGRKYE